MHSLVLKHNQKENKITEYLFSYRNLVMEINLDDYEFYIKPGATDLRKYTLSCESKDSRKKAFRC